MIVAVPEASPSRVTVTWMCPLPSPIVKLSDANWINEVAVAVVGLSLPKRPCSSSAVPAVKYDVILSNPPYEPSALVDAQAPEFAAEPRMAHDGGRDGLAIVRKILQQARTRLQPRAPVRHLG